ncbi:nicotinamide-nucleotide adenylyltransferase [Methanobrevibacter filiformis]|uniref:Nicotinamide-nucleotide adenylyltransferase n=1 Tax=Methanobrevibacter filiformis TaxID=55758 RepID=A0A162FN37_9EURY|nr:nicotinamide-nucleotide adenylyltransferase [Methanobrevibacter filiformis]KZX12520.1 bifunctional NMN adenylyltransferase/nudix hydrolase [Methanobrevibacter filiformis]
MKKSRGIIVGRFQPVHNGHIQIIRNVLEEIDELIIAIGSAQLSHTPKNPFTAGERVTMVKEALNEININPNSYYIIPIPDISNHSLWASHVKTLTPSFNKVYSGNPLVQRLFIENNYEVTTPPLYNRTEYSGREIRNKMINDEKWDILVPNTTYKFIREIDGINRIKDLSQKEINEL